jgi:type II secretory pathway component PulF
LEPAVVLVLAVGVGIVVMAAILPLVRLQEML